MPNFVWSEKYCVNIKELDKQNQTLAKLLNQLVGSLEKNMSPVTTYQILNDLTDLTGTSFLGEETLMKEHEYYDYSIHKKEHSLLTKKIRAFMKKYHIGDKEIPNKIALFLKNWLMAHIIKEDKKLGKYLSRARVT